MLSKAVRRMSPYGAMQAEQGNWIEDGILKFMEPAGFIIGGRQLELEHKNAAGEVVVRGHIDGLIREDAGGLETPWHLWECKGMSAFRFRKLSSGGVQSADPGYYDQVQLYMTLLNSSGYDIESCLFTALAKDPSSVNHPRNGAFLEPIYVEEVKWDPSYGEELLERAALIHQLANSGTLGPRERNPVKDWDCSAKFCTYFGECDPRGAQRRIK